MSSLTPILERVRREVAERRAARPFDELMNEATELAAHEPRRGFRSALTGGELALIAEHKRRSPSAGVIRDGLALEAVLSAYARGGAAALSVLTEAGSFGGSLEDLRTARAAVALPILRKDFILDPYQVPEALLAGADAILLIVAALEPARLAELHSAARALGLDVLVEIHDERELEIAARLGADMIGINNRDLTTLEVDLGRTFALLPELPETAVAVAESGFRTRAELEDLAAAGVDAVLIGEALMRAPDIEAACRALTSPPG